MSASELLIERFLEGSLESFDQLVSIHEKEIFNIIGCLITDEAAREELASKVFVRLIDDAGTDGARADVRKQLLRYTWFEVRACRFENNIDPAAKPAEASASDEPVSPRAGFQTTVSQMPAEVAMAFVLRKVCGLSLDSTAVVLEISQERAIARLTTAFRILRKAHASRIGQRQNNSAQHRRKGAAEIVA